MSHSCTLVFLVALCVFFCTVFGFRAVRMLDLGTCSTRNSRRFALSMLFGRKSPPSAVASEIVIGSAEERMDIRRAADFLTTAMYDEMPRNQRKELFELEVKDLTNRYGETVGGRLPSTLILAKEDSEILGSVGLDCQVRHKELNRFRDLSKTESLVDFLDRGSREEINVVLANLAVRRDRRGQGLARNLLSFAEEQTKLWGYDYLYLLVDSTNEPAQRLYKSAGYKVLFQDNSATCVVSGKTQLQTINCVNVCYSKRVISGNPTAGSDAISGIADLFGGLFR